MSTRKKNGGVKSTNFGTISQADLPSGRKGRHYTMLQHVLQDLQQLPGGRAIKIRLADFSGSAADIRSAIHRATRKRNVEIATSSDDEYFYLWKPTPNAPPQ